jgi:cytochrome c551/c552
LKECEFRYNNKDEDLAKILTKMVNKKKNASLEPNPNISNTDAFTKEEDEVIIQKHKEIGPHWKKISVFFPGRSPAAIKNRWYLLYNRRENYPNEKSRGVIPSRHYSKEEDEVIIQKHKEIGPRWKKISVFFPSRSPAAIKNRWNYLYRHSENCQLEQEVEIPREMPNCPPALRIESLLNNH